MVLVESGKVERVGGPDQASGVSSDRPRRAAQQPWARAITRVAVQRGEILQHFEHGAGTERIAQRQRPLRVAEAQRDRKVDVGRRGDALLRDVARDVDDARDDALCHEAARVADHRHRHAVAGEQAMRGIAVGGVGGGRGHQRAAPGGGERIERIERDRAAAIQPFGGGCGTRVEPARRHHDERFGRGPGAALGRDAQVQQQALRGMAGRVRAADPDGLRSCGGGGSLGRRLLLSVGIAVEAFAGLAAQQAAGQPHGGDLRRPVARLVVELAVDRLHHRMRHVQPGQVHQLERAHAEAGLLAHHRIHVGKGGHAFLHHAQALGVHAAPRVVDDEARSVDAAHGGVAHAPGQGGQGIAGGGGAAQAVDHFDHLHHRHRVEAMEPGHAFGPPACRGNRRDRQRRGVGGEDRLRPHDGLELAEQVALGLQVLDDGLDDEVAVGQVGEGGGRHQMRDGGVGLVGGELALGHQPGKRIGQRGAGGLHGLRVGVEQLDAQAGLGRDLRNAAPHGAGTHDPDTVHAKFRREGCQSG